MSIIANKETFKGEPARFFDWSQGTIGKLTEENCISYATDIVPKPVIPRDFSTPPVDRARFALWQYKAQEYRADKLRWEDKSAKAYGIIFQGVSTVLQVKLNTPEIGKDPYKAWSYLNSKYGTLNISGTRLDLQKDIFKDLKMEDDISFDIFIIEFEKSALDAQVMSGQEKLNQLCKKGTVPTRLDATCEAIVADKDCSWETCIERIERVDQRHQSDLIRSKARDSVLRGTGATMFVGKDRPKNSRNDRRTTMYEARLDPRGNLHQTKCFQCNGPHKFWECLCRHCVACNRMNAHCPVDCPKLSVERKREWETWKNSNRYQKKSPITDHQVPGAARVRTPAIRLIGNSVEEVQSEVDVDDYDEDVAEEPTHYVARVSCAVNDMVLSTWPAPVPTSNSLDDLVLFRPEELELKRVSMVRSLKRKVDHNFFFLDSGASVHCVPNADYLSDVKGFTGQLMAANDTTISVEALGRVNNYIDNVHVTPQLPIALLSEDALRSKGLWVFNPPSLPSSGEFISAYICDQDGRVVFTANQDKLVDVFAQAPDIFIEAPKITTIPRVALASTRMSNKTIDVKGVTDFIFYLHQSLGHPGLSTMCYMADFKTMEDFPVTSTQLRLHWTECIACWKGKMHRRVPHKQIISASAPAPAPTPEEDTPQVISKVIGDKISSDIFGPLPLATAGRKYVITFVDDFSGMIMLGTAKTKEFLHVAVGHVIQEYAAAGHHAPQYKKPIGILQSDAEAIYKSEQMVHLLRSQGIKQQYSAPHTHEQNGVAERFHRWMGESLATLFADAPWVPVTLWPQAIVHLALCFNLMPRVNKDLRVSPFELFYKVKPSFKKFMLLPWGTPVLFVVPKSGRTWKGADHSSEGMYMGPSLQAKEAIRVYHVKTGIIITTYSWHEMPCPPHTWPKFSQSGTLFINQQEEAPMPMPIVSETGSNFTFDEIDSNLPVVPLSISDTALINDVTTDELPSLQGRGAVAEQEEEELIPTVVTDIPSGGNIVDDVTRAQQSEFLADVGRRASLRSGTGLTGHLQRVIARICTINLERQRSVRRVKERTENMPSMKQALSSPEREDWKKAINKELEQLVLLDVLEDPVGPIDKVVETMMVLKRVMDANGLPVKFKARLVAVGSRQPIGTFGFCGSATSRQITVKTFIAGAAARGLKVVGYDVPGAYLQATTAEASTTKGDPNIVVRMPDGSFKKLKKFLYGLKQSGAEWFDKYSKFLLSLGYDRSETEPCLWMWRENREAIFGQPLAEGERYHLLCVFVDDNLAYGNCDVARDFFEEEFKREYGECVRKEEEFTFLGMLVDCKGEDIVISMPNYAEKVVLAGGIHKSKTSSIPGISHWSDKNVEVKPEDLEPADPTEYMRLLGVINFFATTLRFDLLNCVSRLSQHMQAPLVCHMKQLRKICAYVNGSKDLVLTYRRGSDFKLRGFVDASHDSNPGSHGQSGSALFFGLRSAALGAKSSKQKDIAMSSAEAELIALLDLLREIIWVTEILEDMGFENQGPVEIFEDNAATFVYGEGGGDYGRTKHMRRKIANVAAYIKMGVAVMIKVDSNANVADILTKQGYVASYIFLRDGLFNGPFLN